MRINGVFGGFLLNTELLDRVMMFHEHPRILGFTVERALYGTLDLRVWVHSPAAERRILHRRGPRFEIELGGGNFEARSRAGMFLPELCFPQLYPILEGMAPRREG